MSKQKCNYCGKEIESEYMSALENGSPACPECVAEEENQKQSDDHVSTEATGKEKKSKLKRWIKNNKKKFILFVSIIAAVLIAAITLAIIFGGGSSSSTTTKKSAEDELKSRSESLVIAYYKALYDTSSVTPNTASVQKYGDGWRVSGRAVVKDAYGDSYYARWSITYDENMAQIDKSFDTPRKY